VKKNNKIDPNMTAFDLLGEGTVNNSSVFDEAKT